MAWLLIGGIALLVSIIVFFIERKNDYPPYDTPEHLITSTICGFCTFMIVALFSAIICSSLDTGVFQYREKYINLESNIYCLEEIQNGQFAILNLDSDEVNLMYINENNIPVMCSVPIDSTKIYTNIKNKSPSVCITKWELKNWYVKSILGKAARETTYEIYLPNEARIVSTAP